MKTITVKHPKFYDLTHSFPDEDWKPIIGYEGYYEISNYGRVKALQRYRGNGVGGYVQQMALKRLIVGKGKNGYAKVHLYKNNKRWFVSVHRLVAMHFLKGKSKETVNHKCGNKLNNYFNNLEWATYAENNQHAHDIGLIINKPRGSDVSWSKLNDEKVYAIKKLLSEGISQRRVAKLFNVSRGPIQRIAENKGWKHLN